MKRKTRPASTKVKVFTCVECNIEFSEDVEWARHLIWHEKLIMDSISYACNQCGIQYKQLTLLKKHIASVHVPTAILQQSSRGGSGSNGDSGRRKNNKEIEMQKAELISKGGNGSNGDSVHHKNNKEIEMQNGEQRRNGGNGCYGDSGCRRNDEEIGLQNGEQAGNGEKVEEQHQREDSDDEMDRWSEAGSDEMFEEDDQDGIDVGDQKQSEVSVATVSKPSDVEEIHENTCASKERNAESIVFDSTAQTQVTQTSCEPDLEAEKTRRSSRMSSDAYIHKIIHVNVDHRKFNRGRQKNPERIVEDGERKRQHDGGDVVEGNVGKRSRVSGLKNGDARETATGENDLQVGTGESGQQQNSSGRIDQLDIGPQSTDVGTGQQGGEVGQESQKIGELDSGSSLTLRSNQTPRMCRRRTADGVAHYYKETVYTCSECGLELTRPSHLARHKERKHYKGLQNCNICGFQYGTLDQLQQHTHAEHGFDLPMKDNEQGQTIGASVNEQFYACKICGLKVVQLSNLKKHVKTHRSMKLPPKASYTCDICVMVYRMPHTLRRHMLTHESKEKTPSSRKREYFGKLDGDKIVIVDSEQYKRECGAQGVEPKDIQCEQDGVCDDVVIKQEIQCDVESGLEEIERNVEGTVELKSRSEPLGVGYVDSENGQSHMEIKGGIEINVSSLEQLVNEITRKDGTMSVCTTDVKLEDLEVEKAPSHICNVCGLRTDSRQQLKCHLKTHAIDNKRRGTFLCDLCGAVYRCLGFLERHRLTHVVEKSRVSCVEEKGETTEETLNGIPLSEIVSLSDDTKESTPVEQSTDDKSATDKNILIQYNTFYACDECGTKFEQAKDLLRHKLEHRRGTSPPRPFVCQECGLRYSQRNLLEKHLLMAHLKLRPELCNICGKSFRSKQHLEEHIRTHTGEKPFKCSVCNKGFTTRPSFERHELLHTGAKPFKCEVCEKAFAARSTLHSHRVTHTGERRFACTLCGRRFTAGCALKKHLQYMHSGERPFACEICLKTFVSNGNLQMHYETHTKSKAFKCNQCNKRFAQAASLNVHKKLHDGLKPHICKVCERSFATIGNLQEHEVVHSTEKPFSCCECGNSYKSMQRLKVHTMVHSQPGAQPHVCRAPKGGVCIFVKFATFIKTVKTKHACTECGRQFYTPMKLREHMVVHTGEKPWLCTLCGVSFTTAGSLQCHMRIHNGVKPYTCEVCGRQFTQAGNYKQHKSVHTGERRFKCDVCSQTFRLRHILKTHMLRHTGEPRPRRTRWTKKRPKGQKAPAKCEEQRVEQRVEQVVEEEQGADIPCLYVVQPQHDVTVSDESDSEDDGDSEEQSGSSD